MDAHTTTLIAKGAQIVHATFVVTPEEARRHAEGYIRLIDAYSGTDAHTSFTTVRFEELLIKSLASVLQWRNPNQKADWERNREDQYDALRQAMGVGRESPFGRKF